MISYYLIHPDKTSLILDNLIQGFVLGAGEPSEIIKVAKDLPSLKQQKIVFAVQLDQIGQNQSMYAILNALYNRGQDVLTGSEAVILVASPSELYTKSYAQNLIFLLNRLGCSFPGHPLIEVVDGCINFRTWQKNLHLPLEHIPGELSKRQGARFIDDFPGKFEKPRILALHASSRKTSNTVMLWDMIRKHLPLWEIEELNVDKGMVLDCRGCSYRECSHYSKQNSCFYGGVVGKEILPAVAKADVIVWICPNYNDAISANLMAVINRMTALYRKISFYRKYFFAVIVSGNSGSDSVAKQLIGALNVNKGFRLPANFAIMATANDPGDIRAVPGIEEKAKLFSQNMVREVSS
ncbi:MAG: NAD(P)H-dependent oxidoreductase [Dehalobacterium sp.]